MLNDAALARAFKALAHPRRARIFRLLAENPDAGHSFLAIQEATGIGDAPLHHHLREMERCGLLDRRREGATVAHRLDTAAIGRALAEAGRLNRRAERPRAKAA